MLETYVGNLQKAHEKQTSVSIIGLDKINERGRNSGQSNYLWNIRYVA